MNKELLTLIREIELLREENISLRVHAKQKSKWRDIARQQNKFISFIRGSHSGSLAARASVVFDNYWKTVEECKALKSK